MDKPRKARTKKRGRPETAGGKTSGSKQLYKATQVVISRPGQPDLSAVLIDAEEFIRFCDDMAERCK